MLQPTIFGTVASDLNPKDGNSRRVSIPTTRSIDLVIWPLRTIVPNYRLTQASFGSLNIVALASNSWPIQCLTSQLSPNKLHFGWIYATDNRPRWTLMPDGDATNGAVADREPSDLSRRRR
ncbi:Protein of unknown function [Cotesia congregata]|uniref:Uncharacterized protein n=1 Tax=Cotesia congregata TaxID=51543 RepID=A0A8J2MRY3_COTCN|nr:Protein of unknown function [Cotesia congregata]